MIQELDCVALAEDNREAGLRRGDIGTVVVVYRQGEAYEVEFVSSDGQTIALLTLSHDQVRPITDDEATAVRPVDGFEGRVMVTTDQRGLEFA